MNKPVILFLTSFLFFVAAVTGPVLTFATPHHHCPFVAGEMSFCITTLSHLDHWQVAFAAILMELSVLIAIALVFSSRSWSLHLQLSSAAPPIPRYRSRRPTLFQELFSQGLLHPKAP